MIDSKKTILSRKEIAQVGGGFWIYDTDEWKDFGASVVVWFGITFASSFLVVRSLRCLCGCGKGKSVHAAAAVATVVVQQMQPLAATVPEQIEAV